MHHNQRVKSFSLLIYCHEEMGSINLSIDNRFVQSLNAYFNTSEPRFSWLGKR